MKRRPSVLGSLMTSNPRNPLGLPAGAVVAGGTLLGGAIGALIARDRPVFGGLVGGSLGALAGLAGCNSGPLPLSAESVTPDGGLATRADGGTMTLSGIGTGDFTIRFRITERRLVGPKLQRTVLYQRRVCDRSIDPAESYWDVYLGFTGEVVVEMARPYELFHSEAPVADGQLHDVVIRRRSGTLAIFVDGNAGPGGLSRASLGDLPALGVARGNPCEGVGPEIGRVPLDGVVSDIRLTVP